MPGPHTAASPDWRVRLGERWTAVRECNRRYEVRWPCGRVRVVKGHWTYYQQGKWGWLGIMCERNAVCYSHYAEEIDPATPLSDTKGDRGHETDRTR